MKNKTIVNKSYLEQSKTMAEDLLGLAKMGSNTELKRKLKAFIKKTDNYLSQCEGE